MPISPPSESRIPVLKDVFQNTSSQGGIAIVKSCCVWILVLAVVISLGMQPVEAQQKDNRASEPWTVIRAGSLIDGKSDKPRHDQLIIVHGNRIESISDAATGKTPAGANVIDLTNATVLPGLIDSHTHIFLQGEDPAHGGYDANILNAPLALRAARATVAAKRALDQGYIPGPRLIVATRAISTTGGYPLEGYAPELDLPKGAQIVDGPV